jgi:enoyl-CoA hydratase
MGLVNRVVPHGEAFEAAMELARQLCAFPQTCMCQDRLSAYEQFDMDFEKALANEFQRGIKSMETDTLGGAARFAGGEGRHGDFSSSGKKDI